MKEGDKRKTLKMRWTIGVQMYLGLFIFVTLIFVASFLGWKSLIEMNNIQKIITKERIPELSLAIKIGQESSSLIDVAPKFLASQTEKEIQNTKKLVQRSGKNLSSTLKRLSEVTGEQEEESINKFKFLSKELLNNLKKLEGSVISTLYLRGKLNASLSVVAKKSHEISQLLISAIDDQIFFLHTGLMTLKQKEVISLSIRSSEESINYYQSLLSLNAQSQVMSNLLTQAPQLSGSNLIQPLRERFRAALGNCRQSLKGVTNRHLKKQISNRIELLSKIGLGSTNKNLSDVQIQGVFQLLEEVFKEKGKQRQYLSKNRDFVIELTHQTKTLIKGIQDDSERVSRVFEKTIFRNQNQLLTLNSLTIFLALFIGVFFVSRYLIGRIKTLSEAMLTMSQGDLEIPLEMKGDDEITDMAQALEVFRKYAIEAQRINLVEKLAQEIQEKNNLLEDTIEQLKNAQKQMVMQEKLASLGQLVSGIAHEIKNPLNFINNFSLLSKELLEDLSKELNESGNSISEESRGFIDSLVKDLTGNLEKIYSHGQRTDDIVKGMLQHSRGGQSEEDEKEVIELNSFLDRSINLAYQGKRVGSSGFNVEFKKNYGEGLEAVDIYPQEISRVILNLVTNACDAIESKTEILSLEEKKVYAPCLWIETRKIEKEGESFIEILVKDNGPGIPEENRTKIFNPFFTTKPTDKGTGLGLSLSHDIILKHGGSMRVESVFGEFTQFIVELPITA